MRGFDGWNKLCMPSCLGSGIEWRELKNFLTRIRKLQPIFQKFWCAALLHAAASLAFLCTL
jgi:hypothetical protein